MSGEGMVLLLGKCDMLYIVGYHKKGLCGMSLPGEMVCFVSRQKMW